jgi:hypothetical protein
LTQPQAIPPAATMVDCRDFLPGAIFPFLPAAAMPTVPVLPCQMELLLPPPASADQPLPEATDC